MAESSKSKLYFGFALVAILLFSLFLILQIALLQTTLRVVVNAVARIFFLSIKAPPAAQQNVLDTSTWKIFWDEQYGFEFKYPPDWAIDRGRTDLGNDMVIYSPIEDQPYIDISISVAASGTEHFSLSCPITIHEIECKNLKNPGGINYTRSISTGQLQLSNQQQLDGFLQSPNADLQMTTVLTDEKGNPDPLSPQTVKVFDQILSTFKFIK